jgi:type I restriction enzyme S subunit
MPVHEYTVGDVITLIRRPVTPNPDSIYREIGLRSFGRGVFHKSPVRGEEISDKRVFHIFPGDLLFSNVFAWEGAVALSTDNEKGMIGSHRFMTYRANESVADPRYLYYYFAFGPGLEAIRVASPGSAGRNRTLGIKPFAAQMIRIPSKIEQRRIADKLNTLLRKTDATTTASESQITVSDSTLDSAIQAVFDNGALNGWEPRRLDEVADINPRTEVPAAGTRIAFVPMASVNAATGSIEVVEHRDASSIGTGYKRFRRGDVIFARITPCMQNGKSAVFNDRLADVGYGSSEFHVIRPINPGFSEWIHCYVRSKGFRDRAVPFMTGTAGQQRVPTSYLCDAAIPIPSSHAEQQTALNYLKNLEKKRLQLGQRQLKQAQTLKLLRQSILNSAFTGQL